MHLVVYKDEQIDGNQLSQFILFYHGNDTVKIVKYDHVDQVHDYDGYLVSNAVMKYLSSERLEQLWLTLESEVRRSGNRA